MHTRCHCFRRETHPSTGGFGNKAFSGDFLEFLYPTPSEWRGRLAGDWKVELRRLPGGRAAGAAIRAEPCLARALAVEQIVKGRGVSACFCTTGGSCFGGMCSPDMAVHPVKASFVGGVEATTGCALAIGGRQFSARGKGNVVVRFFMSAALPDFPEQIPGRGRITRIASSPVVPSCVPPCGHGRLEAFAHNRK